LAPLNENCAVSLTPLNENCAFSLTKQVKM
jgi:hypothetical protein